MAPLPPSNTARYKVHYTNAGESHTLNFRSHDSPSAIGLNVDDIMTAISGLLYPTTIDLVEFAAQGSNIFNSVTSGIEGNTYGSGVAVPSSPAAYINFIGRSSDGRRVRLAFFGAKIIGVDFRFAPGEDGAIDNAIASLSAPANHFVTIGDIEPVWKLYANGGYNAYWQKQIRP